MLRQITIEFGLPGELSLSAGTAELVQFPGAEVGKPAWLRVSVKWRSSFSFEQDDAGQRRAAEFPSLLPFCSASIFRIGRKNV
jgi:hypothetical protein